MATNGETPAPPRVATIAERIKMSSKKRKAECYELDTKTHRNNNGLALINKLLCKRILKLEARVEQMEAKKRRKSDKPPTEKQLAQWATFSARVQTAKTLYKAQPERTADAWKLAMRQAQIVNSGGDPSAAVHPSDEAAVSIDAIYNDINAAMAVDSK